MSAGTGLTHSEFNLAGEPVHFYQIWIHPDLAGLKPSYDQRSFSPGAWKNRLLPVASGQGLHGAVTFHTYATIYRSDLEAGQKIDFNVNESRRIFIYVTSGSLGVNDMMLEAEDQARIDLEKDLELRANKDCSFVLIDVPSCKGWGYDEKTLRGSKS
jgi:redox-sensitive bicupin YhaK (pirin superfamily)